MSEPTKLLVTPSMSVQQVMECIDRNAKGIALVVDEKLHLIGTITDGDIRRSILSGVNLDLPIQQLLDQRQPNLTPFTAYIGTPDSELLHMMTERDIRHIPLLNIDGQVVDVALLSELVKEYELPLRAIVMAGGYGTRLRPLTNDMPKP